MAEMEALVKALGKGLIEKQALIVTAESCTGGMVAEALTSVAGSTAWFDRGYVTYSYPSKKQMLGVTQEVLDSEGAVSEACVRQMAQGALARAELSSMRQVAVAISGIAGPGGALPGKPVGTVWMAWAYISKKGQQNPEIEAHCFHFDGDRTQVRRQATYAALERVLKWTESL